MEGRGGEIHQRCTHSLAGFYQRQTYASWWKILFQPVSSIVHCLPNSSSFRHAELLHACMHACRLSSLRRQVSLASEFAASGWYFLVGKVKLHREYFSLFPSYHTHFVQRSANLRRATAQQQKNFSDPIPIPKALPLCKYTSDVVHCTLN
ncbi:putative ribonuclease T2 [Trichinella spiralis]|uniref:putative ribonuclease T2 n=1 Tax=Trichinella spiralis TaxID=6334 RepID=UPI0001EFD105|nr:putative ribonuclease T2 [Trichinella spiralis]